MPERDRLLHPVTGSLAAVFLLLLVAGVVSHANRYHSQNNEYATQSKASPSPGSLVPETVPKAASAESRKEYREEADLAAQLRMAASAENAFYVSLLSFFLLAATVIFAGLAWKAAERSVDAAKDTVEETRRIGEAQVRAYLNYSAPLFMLGNALQFHFKISNSGHSPASRFAVTRLSVDVDVFDANNRRHRFNFTPEDEFATRYGGLVTKEPVPFYTNVGFVSEETAQVKALAQHHPLLVFGEGIFVYEDVFGWEIRQPFLVSAEFKKGTTTSSKAHIILHEPERKIKKEADTD